jgi:hypothetical protein
MQKISLGARIVVWMSKWRNPFLAGFMAVWACYCFARILTIVPTTLAQDKITPYVVETEVYGFENDPHGALGIKTTFARRSDGATVRVENIGPLKWGLTGRRITFIDGRSVSVVDAFRTRTTWPPVPPSALATFNARRLKGTPNCVRSPEETVLALDLVAGQSVVAVRTDLSQGPVLGRETDWRAPGLGCLTLTYRVEDQKPDGSWWLRTEGKLVSLRLEEPDAKLFDDGAGYTEAKPSDIEKRLREIESSRVDDKLTQPNK